MGVIILATAPSDQLVRMEQLVSALIVIIPPEEAPLIIFIFLDSSIQVSF